MWCLIYEKYINVNVATIMFLMSGVLTGLCLYMIVDIRGGYFICLKFALPVKFGPSVQSSG